MQLNQAIAVIQNEYLDGLAKPSVWADLGCGSGLFTRALNHLLRPGSLIYAVDKVSRLASGAPDEGNKIEFLQADFEKDALPIGKLDGILMANSLHYVRDKYSFLTKCKSTFSNDVFLIVEYDTEIPVAKWVPYPVSFSSLAALFKSLGFCQITKLSERPSSYGRNSMYAVLSGKKCNDREVAA